MIMSLWKDVESKAETVLASEKASLGAWIGAHKVALAAMLIASFVAGCIAGKVL
jgi:hypothetical protein